MQTEDQQQVPIEPKQYTDKQDVAADKILGSSATIHFKQLSYSSMTPDPAAILVVWDVLRRIKARIPS